MSCRLLGEHFDIHGGGQDLQFPHHENEIAQSEGANGRPFVNTWMHNGFVRVDEEKMSKSLGNFFLIRDILKRYDAEVVRFFILRAHYRSPLNHTEQNLDDAKQALTRLYTALKGFNVVPEPVDWADTPAKQFREAMDDDFNTPEAVAVLFDLANEVNRSRSEKSARLLKSLAGILGLLGRRAELYLQGEAVAGTVNHAAESIQRLIDARVAARKAKNYAEADRIRKELESAGVILEDGPLGTTWRRA
jgi:cysteinyl-tRNA synthetase